VGLRSLYAGFERRWRTLQPAQPSQSDTICRIFSGRQNGWRNLVLAQNQIQSKVNFVAKVEVYQIAQFAMSPACGQKAEIGFQIKRAEANGNGGILLPDM
jgi:hypothetical protein